MSEAICPWCARGLEYTDPSRRVDTLSGQRQGILPNLSGTQYDREAAMHADCASEYDTALDQVTS